VFVVYAVVDSVYFEHAVVLIDEQLAMLDDAIALVRAAFYVVNSRWQILM